MSAVSPAGLTAAVLAGAATGSRSFTALAAAVDTVDPDAATQPERALAHPAVKALLTLGAAQEWVLDKLPNTPSRLERAGLGARVVCAAGAGALLARRSALADRIPVPGEPVSAGRTAGGTGGDGGAYGPAGTDPAADARIPLAGAAAAAAAAVGAAYLGVRFRGACLSLVGRDWPAAAFEDAASLALATAAVRTA